VNVPTNLRCPAHLQHLPGDFAASPWGQYSSTYRAAIKTDAKGEEAWFLSLVVSGKQKPPKGAVKLR
jgi:hypothetical protein